jgi:AGCS family alanine or glycine:cation symporter
MWVKGLFIFNHYFTLLITFPLLFGLGIYLTFRLKGIQFSKLRLGFQHLLKKDVGSEGNISNFEAVAAVLAGNLGTGNISGMAIALTTGGPGALVWMWIMATLGTVIKYAECFLGLIGQVLVEYFLQ